MTLAWASTLLARPRLLPFGGVEVWRTSIANLPVDRHLLSPREEKRASNISHESVRTLLRRILATYTNKPPEELSFGCTSRGKPHLTYLKPPNSALQFNVSHSNTVAFIAVANGYAVGIDVESRTRHLRNAARFAKRWFTPAELVQLQALSLPNIDVFRESLLEAWTRKEAFVKCTGEGIARDLRSFQVSIGPADQCKLLTVDDSATEAENWHMRSLHAIIGGEHDVLSTLVVAAPESKVEYTRIIDLDEQ